MKRLVIRQFTYLRSPYFTWFYENSEGGVFSNSGKQTSYKSCLRHALLMLGRHRMQGIPVTWYTVDVDGNESVKQTQTIN